MPSSVSKPDAIKYLNSGYVYQTYAEERDPAGNIKLFEDETKTTNQTISVEPITSQFSVETALKLFNTRFQYFEFPVEAVETTKLEKFDKELESEIKDTLSNATFEQDVITRRMELTPLVQGSDVVEWYVPTPWRDVNFRGVEQDEKGRFDVIPYVDEVGDSNQKFLTNYVKSFVKTIREREEDSNDGRVKLSGFQRVPLPNSNSPRGGGRLRITPDMLSQIRTGGKLKTNDNDVSKAPWKRNIKLKFSCTWTPENSVIEAFKNHSFIESDVITSAGASDNYVNTVNLRNGVCLIAKLSSDTWSPTWNLDDASNEPIQPMFIQSTSDQVGLAAWKRNDDYHKDTKKSFDALKNTSQFMHIEYVIDSRDLFFDLNKDPNIQDYNGNYRDFMWELMSNHPVILTSCLLDVSVEELPTDYATNTIYGYETNRPKTKYNQTDTQTPQDQFRSLFGKFNVTSQWLGGPRRINGKNIMGVQCGNDKLVLGYTDLNGEWNSLYSWGGTKWIRSAPYVIVNTELLDNGTNSKYQYYDDKIDFRQEFKREAGNDMIAAFKSLDSVAKLVGTPVNNSGGSTGGTTGGTAKISEINRTPQGTIIIPGNKTYTGFEAGRQAKIEFNYKGGNSAPYVGTSISSNMPGVTLELPPGVLVNDRGKLFLYLKGPVGASGPIKFNTTLFGATLQTSLNVGQ